jgi:hypothetical protein
MTSGDLRLNTSRLEEAGEASDAGKRVHPDGFVDGKQVQRKIRATYDFAVDGGVIGDIGLGVTIPRNAVIKKGWIDVVTDLTSGGAATIALNLASAGDVLAALAVASWTGQIDCIQTGLATNMIKLADPKEITATIAAADLTAGKFHVYIEYDISDPVT